jgi:hypothetical protein
VFHCAALIEDLNITKVSFVFKVLNILNISVAL